MEGEEIERYSNINGDYTKYSKDGKMTKCRETYYRGKEYYDKWYDGKWKMHRDDDLPAYTCKKEGVTRHVWYRHGEIYRGGDKPAEVRYVEKKDKCYTKEYYLVNGKWIKGDKFKIMKLEATVAELDAKLSKLISALK